MQGKARKYGIREPSRTRTSKDFLAHFAPEQSKDLATLYTPEMECQVNVAQGNGEPVEGDFNGRKWKGWPDGLQTWKGVRIPYGAKDNPNFDDKPMSFDLVKHVESIGMTGWNWVKRASLWVAFDFDAIVGHKVGLSDAELDAVKVSTMSLPWVTVRKSTSGKHLNTKFVTVRNGNRGCAGTAKSGIRNSAQSNAVQIKWRLRF